MAGEWIKMEISLPDKPEVLRVARILGIDKDGVIGKLVRLWAWFDRNSVDGAVDGVVGADIDAICYQAGFADALMAVGWLAIDTSRERVEIPRFDRHNGESAKKRALKNERQARWRDSASTEASTEASTSPPQKATTREEKRREEEAPRKRAAISRPDDVAEQVWSDWNQLRRAKKAPVTETVLSGARTEAEKAGMTLEQFLSVWCRRGTQGLEAGWLKPHELPSRPEGKRRDIFAGLEQ